MTKYTSISILLLIYLVSASLVGAQARPTAVQVSPSFASGLLIKRVPPEYPREAQVKRIQGTVVLQVRVDREGNVTDAKLVSGHPALAQAAIEAVKKWKYHPYLLNGSPFQMVTKADVTFTLPK